VSHLDAVGKGDFVIAEARGAVDEFGEIGQAV
jgi:hypothetical protein